MTKYIICKRGGEYLQFNEDVYCGWTYLYKCAKTFDTYQKAYRAKNKINKKYGQDVCFVEKFKDYFG